MASYEIFMEISEKQKATQNMHFFKAMLILLSQLNNLIRYSHIQYLNSVAKKSCPNLIKVLHKCYHQLPSHAGLLLMSYKICKKTTIVALNGLYSKM